MVEDKERGLVPFVPRDYQVPLILALHRRARFLLEKPPQYGATTAAAMYYAFAMVQPEPLHLEVVSQDEDTAMRRIMHPIQLALETARLTDEEKRRLKIGGEHREEYLFEGEFANNRITMHAPTPRAMHSSDGNAVLLDEVARMPNVEYIWRRAQRMLPDDRGGLCLISTHRGRNSFFNQCCQKSEELGLERLRWNWRVNPARDDAWYAAELEKAKAAGMEAEFREEMDLLVTESAEDLFDILGLINLASSVRWAGSVSQAGHSYIKAFDLHQSSRVGSAKTVCYVIDRTLRPAQVVYRNELLVKPGKTVTEQKLDFIATESARFAGDNYLDITNDRATAELAKVRGRKFGFRFVGADRNPKIEWDKNSKMWLVQVGRPDVQSNATGMTGTGKVVVHLDRFPELEEGLKSAHHSAEGQRNSKNIGGKNVDDLDCFLMLCWALRGSRPEEAVDEAPARRVEKPESGKRKIWTPGFSYKLRRVF